MRNQYQQLTESCERYASFSTDPAFARMLLQQAALYRQLSSELSNRTVVTREHLKDTMDRLAALYLQRDDAMVAGACYQAMKPLINYLQRMLSSDGLPKDLQQVISRHYSYMDQRANVMKQMMTSA
ncbi:hypothetical protein [Tellurirhabdus rosea]|uniref:hypothetical protein n=1 Tax=Tellurirhabdus rosea TaxID=2674997 RepID=UPI00225803E3|nr:hypothetical protein [Tellurirhabdus rosea]